MINLEEGSLGIGIVGRAILLFLLLNLPDLSEQDPPHYHVLDKCLLCKDFSKLFLSLYVLGCPLQDLKRVIAVVRKECLAEIGKLYSLGCLNVKIFHKGVDLSLCIVDLHF
jgi:hypothetical protein